MKVLTSSCPRKVPVIFVKSFRKLKFSRQIFEKLRKHQIFFKIRPVGAGLFGADGQTDVT